MSIPINDITIRHIARLADLCQQAAVPFVAYAMPGSDTISFFSNPDSNAFADASFTILPWLATDHVTIGCQLDVVATQRYLSTVPIVNSSVTALPVSTDRDYYLASLESLVAGLRASHAKVVISRVLTIDTHLPQGEIFARLLGAFPANRAAMRYLYFTPATGAWCGMTPEKVITVDRLADTFSTVALAGTRAANEVGEWDAKNIDEHQFVVNHIAQTLDRFPVSYAIGPMTTLRSASVDHLLTPFNGNLHGVDPNSILSSLHPTPAIAGLPIAVSLNAIARIERHQRQCYGGTVTISDTAHSATYLNLRCAQIAAPRCTLYAGGGITAQSIPAAEWDETTLKLTPLLTLLQP